MRTFSTEGVVLKRANVGEADRLITVFTRDHGKLTCLAKGVRKITSTRRSALEPGTHAKLFFSRAGDLPILAQALCIESFPHARNTLSATRDLSQILEILDTVTVASDEQGEVFDDVLKMLARVGVSQGARGDIVKRLSALLATLGFQDVRETAFSSINEYVEFLSNRKMKSFGYLTVKV